MIPVSRGNGPLKERYRPQSLEELAPTANRTRLESIGRPNSSRVFLFEGPPGAGKTTCARIIARRVNCHLGISAPSPCLTCDGCRNFLESQDYTEVNASDERGIDSMRELVEGFNYKPAFGHTRKVYVIDEIHQLTGDAQEILNKHLEDPPAHVLVLLCTTSTKNVKKALLQRGERIAFNPLTRTQGIEYMAAVLSAENAKLTAPIGSIFEASNGSVREMLNLLQAALDGGNFDPAPGEDGVGEEVPALFKALTSKNWEAAAEILARDTVKAKPESTRIGVENYARAIALKNSRPNADLVGTLKAMSGSLLNEPVQISQYNLFVLKCLQRCVG